MSRPHQRPHKSDRGPICFSPFLNSRQTDIRLPAYPSLLSFFCCGTLKPARYILFCLLLFHACFPLCHVHSLSLCLACMHAICTIYSSASQEADADARGDWGWDVRASKIWQEGRAPARSLIERAWDGNNERARLIKRANSFVGGLLRDLDLELVHDSRGPLSHELLLGQDSWDMLELCGDKHFRPRQQRLRRALLTVRNYAGLSQPTLHLWTSGVRVWSQ